MNNSCIYYKKNQFLENGSNDFDENHALDGFWVDKFYNYNNSKCSSIVCDS